MVEKLWWSLKTLDDDNSSQLLEVRGIKDFTVFLPRQCDKKQRKYVLATALAHYALLN